MVLWLECLMIRLCRFVAMLLMFSSCALILDLGSVEAQVPDVTRVLLLTGANNHNWKQTTPALERIYKDSGAFVVDVTDDASTWTAESLKKYDVIVSNWTNFPSQDRIWGPKAEAAFLDFVRQGKGFVLFHAASACFNTWPEYQRMIGSTWGPDTGHGARHLFDVTASDLEHPITARMPRFSIVDELWHRTAKQPTAKPLCEAFSSKQRGGSGQVEPVAFCSGYGRGRCFHLVLGHDVQAMDSVGWIMLMLRGTQWAAACDVTLEVPFDLARECRAVAQFKQGQDRKVLARLDDLTRFAAGYPALRTALADALAGALTEQATPEAKAYYLRQLGLIGSPRHASVLASFLADPHLSLQARSGLEAIGGEASAAVLVEALPKLDGLHLSGAIQSLGQIGSVKAVPGLASYATHGLEAVAESAIQALAHIGGTKALEVLKDCDSMISESLVPKLAHALLSCAEGLDSRIRAPLYESLMTSAKAPTPVRSAAFIGLMACDSQSDQAAARLVEALAGYDTALQAAALTYVRTECDMHARRLVARWIARAPDLVCAPLIRAVAAAGDADVLPDLAPLLASPSPEVRQAVLEAVGLLGDASHVAFLVRHLEVAGPQEQAYVQAALERLSGQETEALIVQALKNTGSSAVQVRLIRVLVTRQYAEAVPACAPMIWSPDRAVQIEAIRALGGLGDVTACSTLIQALDGTESSTERNAIEKAINEMGARLSYPEDLLELLANSLSRSSDQARVALYRIMGHFGNQAALDMVRAGLKDTTVVRDACVRVLCKWPNSSPLPDLLDLAEHADSPTHRILALRGFASLYGNPKNPSDVPLAVRAFAAAARPEEKKMLLAVMPMTPNKEALGLVVSGLEDSALTEEAALALARLARVMPDEHRDAMKSALAQAAKKTTSLKIGAQINGLLIKLNRPPNLARGAVASSPDGWDKDGAAGGDPAGIDGNPETYWDEVNGKPEYRYQVAFGKSTTVSALDLMGYAQHSFAPRDFNIVCDGKVVLSVEKATYVDNRFVVTFPATSCKTVTLHITGSYGPSPAIRELALYHPPAGSAETNN